MKRAFPHSTFLIWSFLRYPKVCFPRPTRNCRKSVLRREIGTSSQQAVATAWCHRGQRWTSLVLRVNSSASPKTFSSIYSGFWMVEGGFSKSGHGHRWRLPPETSPAGFAQSSRSWCPAVPDLRSCFLHILIPKLMSLQLLLKMIWSDDLFLLGKSSAV